MLKKISVLEAAGDPNTVTTKLSSVPWLESSTFLLLCSGQPRCYWVSKILEFVVMEICRTLGKRPKGKQHGLTSALRSQVQVG